MDNRKYIGMDVHQASISITVSDAAGKVLMESIIETKAGTVLEFIQGLRGSLWVTFEEGTSAAWLYDLLKPHVTKVVVCDPRRNALLKAGNKNDRVDARKLSDLLRAGLLTPVYHGESGVRTLRELSRSYLAASKDLTRVMNRLKAIYRSWAIPCAGQQVYSPRHRAAWLEKLGEAGVRRRAEQTYQQLDFLMGTRKETRKELLAESRKTSCPSAPRTDSPAGPDPGRPSDRSHSDTASFPYEAPTVELLRAGLADAEQRRIPVHRGTTAACAETTGAARSQRQP